MKRSLALLVSVLVSVVVPATAAAYLLPPDLLTFIASVPPTNDFAVGEGKFSKGQPAEQFNIAAHGSPLDAHGHVRFNSGFGEARGDVECVLVMGNKAGVAGPFDDPIDEQFPYFVVGLEDNGEPTAGPRDRAVLSQSTEIPPDCGLSTVGLGTEILQGNIVVKDR